MHLQLVIFDLDGTLLDTLADLHESINHALSQYGFPLRTLDQVRQDVGNGIRLLVQRSVPPDTAEDVICQVYEAFRIHYRDHCTDQTSPYPGIPSLLTDLRERGIRTAVVSNKADFAVQLICRTYFPGQFDLVLGERPEIPKKPAPEPVYTVLRELDIPKSQAVYIGDSQVDIETARNAGLPCISVDWGFRSRDQLEEAGGDPIVSSPEDLLRLLVTF